MILLKLIHEQLFRIVFFIVTSACSTVASKVS